MSVTDLAASFSTVRLGSESLPADLSLLLEHADRFQEMTGVAFSYAQDWAPWLDTSYLSEEEKRNPEIFANVKAIAEVCSLITFIAELEDSQYIGFWRGLKHRSISESPLVILDNEGQFRLCACRTLAEAILEQTYDDETFAELKSWFQSLGIEIGFSSLDELAYPEEPNDPGALHTDLFEKYRAAASA